MKQPALILAATGSLRRSGARFPLLALLHPGEQTRLCLLMLGLGLLLGVIAMRFFDMLRWQATLLVLGLLLLPGIQKWRADGRRYGAVGMTLSIIIALQGFHMIEHLTQWVQNHVLRWSARISTGLLSAANSEWVHFIWNWGVLMVVLYLVLGGVRNRWAWLLLGWSLAHTLEHSYMFVRFLEVQRILADFGQPAVTAQGLPGIVGRDGWLARSEVTRSTFLCRLPGLTTATRLDVHFWWNAVESGLLLAAANAYLRVASPGATAATQDAPASGHSCPPGCAPASR